MRFEGQRKKWFAAESVPSQQQAALPRTIWMLWLQGWDEAPEVARACRRRWTALHPGWQVHSLSRETVDRFVDLSRLVDPRGLHRIAPAALSDLIRIALLAEHGGVWVDATVYPNRPLEDWLPQGFLGFERPVPSRLISSWFLAARTNDPLIARWYDYVRRYWRLRRAAPRDYFWFHHLFEAAYRQEPAFRARWDQTPKLAALGPHCLAPYETRLVGPMDDANLAQHQAKQPLFKLTHKLAGTRLDRDSCLKKLLVQSQQTLPARRATEPKRVLVAWYGAFEGHGTIGDLLSLIAVTRHLQATGHDVEHATHSERLVGVAGRRVRWDEARAEDYDAFVFVCGPILARHVPLAALLERFAPTLRIGVGVSLFPRGHPRYLAPFDLTFAREGRRQRYEDVAVLAQLSHPSSEGAARAPCRRHGSGLTVGLVLRGPQTEYGQARCLDVKVEELASQASRHLEQTRGARVTVIDNHLSRAGVSAEEIEAQYRRCDLILTSRFHGAVMALRNSVPFVAIDQIAGGGKVSTLLDTALWPHVYRADRLGEDDLFDALEAALAPAAGAKLAELLAHQQRGAQSTLFELAAALDNF